MRTDGSSSETGASGIGEKRRRRMKILGHVLAIGVSAGLPIRRFVTAVGLALAISVLAAGTALAGPGGAGTVSVTNHFHGVIDQESGVNPCTGQSGVLTLIATNAVEHITTNANGFWATFTAEGVATFAPDNGSPISGHFAVWDGENGNLQNQTATGTFNVHIDGVTVHETIHMSLSASGISTSFDKSVLSCR